MMGVAGHVYKENNIMSGTKLIFRLSLAAGALFLWGASSLSAQQVINCSSEDGHRHYCSIDARHADINMVKQRSDARCEEGYSWGRDRHGVWVDHGCRADFQVVGRDHDHDGDRDDDDRYRSQNGYGRGSQIQAITCSSDDMHRHFCPANTNGGVRLYKQISDAPCQEGYSWGFDDHGIWVDRGCRADFQTGDGGR
jgi:hypothetical protein